MDQPDESAAHAGPETGLVAPLVNADRARNVTAELDSLFAEIGDLPPPPREVVDAPLTLPAIEPAASARSPLIGAVGALLTVLMVGGAVGILAQREQWLQPEAAQAARIMSAPVPPPPARAMAATAPETPLSAPSLEPSHTEANPPPPAPPPKQGVALAGAAPAILPIPRPAQIAVPSVAAPRLVATPERRQTQADACEALGPSAPSSCFAPALGAADNRLRRAFDAALSAGVPGQVMNRYRAEWDDQRRRAAREPLAVIESYQAMADELRDYAADAADPG